MKKMKKTLLIVANLLVCLHSYSQSDSIKHHYIDEVVVTGTRVETNASELPTTVTVVQGSTIEEAKQQSLLPLLTEQVPGYFSTARSTMGYGVSAGAAGAISIRGLKGASGEVMVLIDGHPQYMGIMGHPLADVYQSYMAERVEVVRGAASMLYGSNAMGGVVNIITKKMKEDGMITNVNFGYGSFNTMQTDLTNMYRHKRFSSTIGGSYSKSDGHREGMDFKQYSGFAKVEYDVCNSWAVFADVNATHFDASQPGSIKTPLVDADQEVTRGVTSVGIRNKYQRTSGSATFFYNWGKHWLNDGYTLDTTDKNDKKLYRFDSHDHLMGISANQNVSLFKGNKITFGADWFRMGGNAQNTFVEGPQDGNSITLVERHEHEVTGYVDFRQDIIRLITFDAGVRLDHHSKVGTEWIPQVGLSFHLNDGMELKATAGKGFKFPTLKDMYFGNAANPELKPESLWNYELAFSQRIDKLMYGINLFYIKGKDIIATLPQENGKNKNVNTERVKNRGIEAIVAYAVNKNWTINANYSYLHMKYAVVAAPEVKMNAGCSYAKRKWKMGTNFEYINNLYTSVSPIVTEEYLLWNVRGSYDLTRSFTIWAKGENILNKSYEINAGYPMPLATAMVGLSLNL